MSEDSVLEDQVSDLIERYILFLRGRGAEPDLGHLELPERRAMRARLEIVDALADRAPALPSMVDDPVAKRLGLVSDRRPGGRHGGSEAHSEAIALITGREHDARPTRRVLDELESTFDGQVAIDWSPSWADWHAEGLEPLAQCSVLGDAMALFIAEHVSGIEEPVEIASFLRGHPDISAVGLVSRDASSAVIMSAATCTRAIDPVRGWLEPGSFVITESFDLTLTRYFQHRLPRWDRVSGLGELLELGDFAADARQIVADEIDFALRTRPRLEHKRQAQVALRKVDLQALSTLIVAVQVGSVSGPELVNRVRELAEMTP